MNQKVQDTIPHMQESSELHDRVQEALSKRVERNNKMSRKQRAKQRDIRIGGHVLVCNRRSGSKFMLPFEKDTWVVSAIKGTMVIAKRNQETITRNISFFKAFHMSSGGMEIKQTSSPATVSDGDDEGSVDFDNCCFPLPNPKVVVDAPLLAAREGADMQGSEVAQSSDQGMPESLPVGLLPPRQGLERYNLRPRPPRSTRLRGFVVD
ncbi:hypothetical protein NDU88_003073 [Pleurodeles waltl]|uniref:Uncharacterized protein n=1 Tax=Pleurodeles waltl TaxID=8319 RepID=A0AAV7Q8N7_PLEWA|nr:hypothetical protein NDU88_003073 [Pleurodeles waltl]